LIKAAEASGTLEKTFSDLSTSLAREAELRSRVRSALAYPAILLVMSLAIILFLTTYALPKIAALFEEGGISPPGFSRVVFGVGLFIGAHWIPIISTLVVALVGGTAFFGFTELGRRLVSRGFAKFPLTRRIYKELAIQRFASTMSSLMKAGLPIVQAVNITAETVGAEEFRFALQRIASEGLSKGLTIGEAFRREPIFPKVVTNLIAVSENAGHLDEVLKTLAEFYANNVDNNIKTLVSVLEPVLLLVMGGLVALIALSIILPIYQIASSTSQLQ
jgi:type II secretory pathway component PulF